MWTRRVGIGLCLVAVSTGCATGREVPRSVPSADPRPPAPKKEELAGGGSPPRVWILEPQPASRVASPALSPAAATARFRPSPDAVVVNGTATQVAEDGRQAGEGALPPDPPSPDGPSGEPSGPGDGRGKSGAPSGPPGGLGGFGGPGGGGPPGYDAAWYPSRPVRGQNTDLGFVRQGLNIGGPVWQNGEDKLIATLGVRHTLFSTDAILPDTGRAFPEQLWNMNLGLNYKHQFANGWSGMLMGGFGSASDKPFNSLDEMNFKLGAILRRPAHNGRDAWIIGAMYNSAGNLQFPIPMIAYSWNPSEKFQMNIGLPFSLTWKPTEDWTIAVSGLPPMNINARVTYQATERISLYGGYENATNTYFLADRLNNKDRLFEFEQRLITGVRWDAWRHATLDLNAGYSFGRRYGQGESQGDDLRDEVKIGAGAFIGANFRIRF